MAVQARPWEISYMPADPGKKAEAETRARALYRRLMALARPAALSSNNKWTEQAGVSTSFFTNMQGGTKPASEPSIGNLRRVLEAAGTTIPEFFAEEAEGRLVPAPTRQALETAIRNAWPSMPRDPGKRPGFLAEVVLRELALPSDRPSSRPDADASAEPADAAVPPPRAATS